MSLAWVLLGNPHVGSMGDFQRYGSAGLPPEPWFPHPGGNELVTLPPVPGFVTLRVLGSTGLFCWPMRLGLFVWVALACIDGQGFLPGATFWLGGC